MKQTWFAAALLSAVLFGVPGCKTADTTDDGTPPPEMTDGSMESGLEGGETAADEGAAAAEQGAEAAGEGAEAAAEAGEQAAEAAGEATEQAGEATESGEAAGGEQASSGLEVTVVLGDNGAVEVRSGGEVVGTIQDGKVSDELASWLQGKAQGEEATITLLVPVSMSFDEVGMPLMKACFAAGFEPTSVNYKPVTE